MERLNYWQLPGFENIYLEDSYVLSINANISIQILLKLSSLRITLYTLQPYLGNSIVIDR